MQGFWDQVWTNVVANLVAAALLAFVPLVIAVALLLRKRHRLFDFFGVSDPERGVAIYVSRLQIKPKGTTGVGPITTGYIGPAITRAEFMGARLVQNLFEARIVARVPRTLRQVLRRLDVALEVVLPTINLSDEGPAAAAAVPALARTHADSAAMSNQSIVIIGSPVYNLLSAHHFAVESCPFRFDSIDLPEEDRTGTRRTERIFRRREGSDWVSIPGRGHNKELGVILRTRGDGCTVFLCAGLGSSGSYGAVRFLVEEWPALRSRYRDGDFAICLEFPNQEPDCDGEPSSVCDAVIAWQSQVGPAT